MTQLKVWINEKEVFVSNSDVVSLARKIRSYCDKQRLKWLTVNILIPHYPAPGKFLLKHTGESFLHDADNPPVTGGLASGL